MSDAHPPTLVLLPELGFAALRERMEAAGWHLGPESQEAPLVEGEPNWCEWWHDAGDATICGAHLIGPQAATLIQQLVQAMQFGIPAHRLAREQIWCHPALPELIENALLDAVEQLPAGTLRA